MVNKARIVIFNFSYLFQAICTSLKFAAWVKGVTFDRVVKRIRDLYANGVTSVKAILSKIKEIFGINVLSDRKRRALGKKDFQASTALFQHPSRSNDSKNLFLCITRSKIAEEMKFIVILSNSLFVKVHGSFREIFFP